MGINRLKVAVAIQDKTDEIIDQYVGYKETIEVEGLTIHMEVTEDGMIYRVIQNG